jgi:hypothetical protein
MKLADLVRRFGVAPWQFKAADGRNRRGYLRVEVVMCAAVTRRAETAIGLLLRGQSC